MNTCCQVLFVLLVAPSLAWSDAPTFEKDVQPILNAQCIRCHGDKAKRADLDLRSLAALLHGGESGPVVVPGQPEKSKLYEMVHTKQMPPSKELSKKDQEILHHWIEAGAKSEMAVAKAPEISQHDIVPLMMMRCSPCHGQRKKDAGLDLTSKLAMLKGGKSGPAIVLGKPEESLALKKIHSGAMPPNKRLLEVSVKPMTLDEIEKLTQWIRRGAPEIDIQPDVATTEPDTLVTDRDRRFWAFQPPARVTPPKVDSPSVRNPIDAFLLEKLNDKGMSFTAEADRLTLLRRATFDLTGLPPEPEQVLAFLRDPDPRAYEKLIDRLLESPRYGERWGRYWLDLAGYADSEGKRSQDPIRPHAWRYRDYVVRSFNADKPYDRFLLEQLAGDDLADWTQEPMSREVYDNLVATSFLRLTPDGTGSDVVNYVPDRLDVIADEMQVLGSAVLGLTIHCARCHTHKYDPIPQRDYYRLLAVFKGAYDEHDWLRPTAVKGQGKSNRPSRVIPRLPAEEKTKWEERQKTFQAELDGLKKEKATPDVTKRIKELEAAIEPAGIQALWDRGEPSATYLYRRGDFLQPGKLVGPGVLSVLTDGKTPFVYDKPFPGSPSTGRRLAFAKWLTQPDHPLTARVLVNRVWKHHFGEGIVRSLDNFGNTGYPPSHPELLDWLAQAFVGDGWSIKKLHRLLMTSTAYRQSSSVGETHEKLDPENVLLSRMPLKRMEAEVVYDATIAVAGRLKETPFGPPDPIVVRKDGLILPAASDDGWRRSLYVQQRRSQMPTLLETFDLPQMNPNCVLRVDSTVASQALYLKNNPMVQELAGAFAERVARQAGADPRKQIDQAFLIALGRLPTDDERQVSVAALNELTRRQDSQAGLTAYCHTLLNSAAFLYID